MRRLCWDWQPLETAEETAAVIDEFLREARVRQWQRELAVPVLTEALTADGELGALPAQLQGGTQNLPDTPDEG